VETVKASEKTGDLAEAMARYIAYHQQVDAIRRKVLSASVYPVVLLGAGVLVALFLLGYVVPRFSAVYDDLGKQMPWGTGLLMGWGRFLHEHAVAAGLAALGAARDSSTSSRSPPCARGCCAAPGVFRSSARGCASTSSRGCTARSACC